MKSIIICIFLLLANVSFALTLETSEYLHRIKLVYMIKSKQDAFSLVDWFIEKGNRSDLDKMHFLVMRAIFHKDMKNESSFEKDLSAINELRNSSEECKQDFAKCYDNEDFSIFSLFSDDWLLRKFLSDEAT